MHQHCYQIQVFSHLHGYQDLHCNQISGFFLTYTVIRTYTVIKFYNFFPPTLLFGLHGYSAPQSTYTIMNVRYHLRIVQQLQHVTLADLNTKYNFLIYKGFVTQMYNFPILNFQRHFTMSKINQILPKKFHCRIQNQGHNF